MNEVAGEITREEMMSLVEFIRGSDGSWHIGNVNGSISGNIGDPDKTGFSVFGNIYHDIYGTVWGNIRGNVRGNVLGIVFGSHQDFVPAPVYEVDEENWPKDIDGNKVLLGPWYWSKDRRGNVRGVGRLLATIGSGTLNFYINETGYDPVNFVYEKYVGRKPFMDKESFENGQ